MTDFNRKGATFVYHKAVRNFLEELNRFIVRDTVPLRATYHRCAERLKLIDTIDLPRVPIAEGDEWGQQWESGYFLLEGEVAADWPEVGFQLAFGGEALLYTREGIPQYGLTAGSIYDFEKPFRKDLLVVSHWTPGTPVCFYIEAAANGLFGVRETSHPHDRAAPDRHGSWTARVERMRVGRFDREAWHLRLDVECLLHLYEQLDPGSVRAVRILRALFDASSRFVQSGAEAARRRLRPELDKPAHASSLSTTVIGHAHIDTAWLWPMAETRRKVVRTVANQLDLLRRYPTYRFGASAPQHYEWIRTEHPGLFDQIVELVREGRWELQGGMWIEPDCNLISGESLVRQIVHGQRYWKTHFGRTVKTCWIPDVFGYPATLPQILRQGGMPCFLTQKMSWSKFNEYPNDSFRWRGLDGSEVVTHFPPEYTYNSHGRPGDLISAERNFHQKEFLDEFVTLLGVGDGGGGPNDQHVERILRSENLESVPRATFGSVDSFFDRLTDRLDDLPVWTGELYLEYHRGTYTSQAMVKKNNRRLEEGLRAMEALWSACDAGAYPRAEVDKLIRTMLLLQFHDILPGSSIHQVYLDALARYRDAFTALSDLTERAADHLLDSDAGGAVICNPLSVGGPTVIDLSNGDVVFDWAGPETVMDAPDCPTAPSDRCVGPTTGSAGGTITAARWSDGGDALPLQVVVDCDGIPHSYLYADLPPLASVQLRTSRDNAVSSPAWQPDTADALVLENEHVVYRFARDGSIVAGRDKQRDADLRFTPAAPGNRLTLYHDAPHSFEAWDIDFYYTEQFLEGPRCVDVHRLPAGPVLQGLRFTLHLGEASEIVQDVLLGHHEPNLWFRTMVRWNEQRKLLRVDFPVNPAVLSARSDISFGWVERPTVVNTQWDFAKFEFPARTFVDVASSDSGAALVNDCKYGYSCRNGRLGLSLLRAPLSPDPDADVGTHRFTYGYLPHAGHADRAKVHRDSALLNRPPVVFRDRSFKSGAASVPLDVQVGGAGVTVHALKPADDGDGIVVRIGEIDGRQTVARVTSPTWDGATVCETDLLEEELPGSVATLLPLDRPLAPFEIVTLRIRRA